MYFNALKYITILIMELKYSYLFFICSTLDKLWQHITIFLNFNTYK